MRSPRASGWRNVHQNMRYAKRTAEIMPSPTPSTPSYLRGQARRVGATRLEPGKYSILHNPRQRSGSCSSAALRRNLFTVRRAGETWRAALPRNAWPASQSPQSFFSMRSHMFVGCSIEAKNSFTGAGAACAAPREGDTASGISLSLVKMLRKELSMDHLYVFNNLLLDLWHNSALLKAIMKNNLLHLDCLFHEQENRNVSDLLLSPSRHDLLLDPLSENVPLEIPVLSLVPAQNEIARCSVSSLLQ